MADNLTLESIGQACGVSQITVSRALRGMPNVRPETANRIREYAESIGYKPNAIARSLAGARNGEFHLTSTRSIVLPYNEERISGTSLFWDFVAGAAEAASLRKSSIEVMAFRGGEAEFDFIRALVAEDRIAGLLDFNLQPRTMDYLLSKKVPVVTQMIGVHQIGTRRNAMVYPDCIEGYLLAWQYLLGLGHRRFGFITPPSDVHYRQCLAAAHLLPEPPRIEQVIRTHTIPSSDTICRALLEQLGQWRPGKWPTVLFCANDDFAHQTVVGLTEMGISVPDDVSIFGYDDAPASRFCNPPICTVRLPRKECGEAMFRLVKDIIDGRPGSRTRVEILPMELIKRKSVKKMIP